MIRIDDFPTGIRVIQDDYIPIFEKILDCFSQYNIPIHVGFVPKLMDKQRDSFLLKYSNIIPVQHGLTHCYDEYSKKLIQANDILNCKTIGAFDEFQTLNEDVIFDKLNEGKKILSNFFNRDINLYIPVCNIANKNTVNAINRIYKGVLGQNIIKGADYTIQNYLFDFYGGLVDINYAKQEKTFCFHITWEYDAINRLGFDVWYESFKKFAEYYTKTYNIQKLKEKRIENNIIKENYKLLFKYPIRQRKEKFFETLDKYYSMMSDNKNFEFIISIDSDDKKMNTNEVKSRLNKYDNLKYFYGNSKTKIQAINADINNAEFDIIVLVSDDMIPIVKHFDNIIRDKMSIHFSDTDGVLWFNDGSVNGDKLNTLCILGKKYYSRFNYIYNPEYKSLRCDNEFMIVSQRLGRQMYFKDCIIRHEHYAWGYDKPDDLLKKNDSYQSFDEIVYDKRFKNGFRNTLPKMCFYTSINPNPIHKERQLNSINTWLKLGVQVFSVNHEKEIKELQKEFNHVYFISTKESSEEVYGKPYIKVNTILNIAKESDSECICLINSDIEVVPNDNELFDELLDKSTDGLVMVSKYNYDENHIDSIVEGNGIDVFAFNKKYIDLIPKSFFSLGQPVWDYWLPLQFAKNNVPIFHINEKLAYHKNHGLLWNKKHWELGLESMNKENNYNEANHSKVSGIMRKTFMDKAIKIGESFDSKMVADLLKDIENPVIFELGANKGQDTINFANIKNSKVHAFECDKRNKLEHLPSNVNVIYKAISHKDGIEELWLSEGLDGSEWTESNSIRKPKNHLVRYKQVVFNNKESVESITLDTYCKENKIKNIDFIWADLQGAESNMIIGASKILKKTRYLFTEYSDDEMYEGQVNRKKLLELLPEFNVVGYYGNNILLKNNNYDNVEDTIPKRAFFIWGKGTPLSYLRFLTLKSFRDLHPDYEMILYLSCGKQEKNWKDDLSQEFYNQDKKNIKDYLYHVGTLNVEVREYNDFKNLNPAHISDLFRWKILYEQGGWYFDLDQIFLNRIEDIVDTSYSFIFGCKSIYFVGVLGAKKGLDFFKYVTKRQMMIIDNKKGSNYLMFSTILFSDCMKYAEFKKLNATGGVLNTENEVFYPIHCSNVKIMYEGKADFTKLKNTIAVHWHGGHNDSQAFNLIFNEEFVKTSTDSISTYVKSLKKGN